MVKHYLLRIGAIKHDEELPPELSPESSRCSVKCKVESGPKLKVKINGKHLKIVTLAHLKLVANFSP